MLAKSTLAVSPASFPAPPPVVVQRDLIVASMELENTGDRGIVSEGLRDESTVRRVTVDGVVDTGARSS